MREKFKKWRKQCKFKKPWGRSAIVTSIVLAIVCGFSLLPDRALQPDSSLPSQNPENSRAESSPHPAVSGLATIAAVFGAILLVNRFRKSDKDVDTADFRAAELSGANFCDADLSGADLSGADLSGADLSGADLSDADLSGANLVQANLSGANLNGASLRLADLKGADLRYTNLRHADLRYANLCEVDLRCTFLSGANFSEANLSGALLFFVNLRGVLNLEPRQLKAKPSPFLCHTALPYYSQQPTLNPNFACDRIPQLLSDRYHIPLEEAQEIVYEARQYHWDNPPKD